MFHSIPEPILARMAYLEDLDRRDRQDGTPRMQRLRQVPPESGRFLALMAAAAPPGPVLEIGTSAGYSTLWLALACRARRDRVTTFELLPAKVRLAQETFAAAQVEDAVELVAGDALAHLETFSAIAFCFLDAEKELYAPVYELVVARLAPGGLFLADNLLSHAEELAPFREAALADPRLDALVAPVGKGILLARRA